MDLLSLIQLYPKTSVIIIGVLVSFFISVVNYFVLDKDKMRESKAKQKALQEEIKLHKDNPTKAMELQKEMMSHAMDSMKHSFKPMLITFLPIVLFFGLVRNWYATTEIAKTWIWYYIGGSIASSMLFRKWFNLP